MFSLMKETERLKDSICIVWLCGMLCSHQNENAKEKKTKTTKTTTINIISSTTTELWRGKEGEEEENRHPREQMWLESMCECALESFKTKSERKEKKKKENSSHSEIGTLMEEQSCLFFADDCQMKTSEGEKQTEKKRESRCAIDVGSPVAHRIFLIGCFQKTHKWLKICRSTDRGEDERCT